MQRPLCLESLGKLDNGAAGAIIDAAFMEMARDLDDRGSDGKERSVEIIVKTKKTEGGMIVTHVEARPKMPARRTAGHLCKTSIVGRQAALIFQDMAPEDPDQRTIDEFESRAE